MLIELFLVLPGIGYDRTQCSFSLIRGVTSGGGGASCPLKFTNGDFHGQISIAGRAKSAVKPKCKG